MEGCQPILGLGIIIVILITRYVPICVEASGLRFVHLENMIMIIDHATIDIDLNLIINNRTYLSAFLYTII